MSSLDPDEADKQLQRAVPWVSDPQHQEQRDNETRRLEEDVLEAAKRLQRELAKPPSPPPPAERQTAVGFRLQGPRPQADQDDRTMSEERARKIWAQLKPEFITPPPQDGFGLHGLVKAAGILGAIAASAIIALVVVNVVHHPTIGADVAGDEQATKGNSLAATTLGDLARVSEAQANMTHADEPTAPAESSPAPALPNDLAAPKSLAAKIPEAVKVEPARPEMTAPAASPVPTTRASPEPQAASPLPPDEIASLMKRGRDLIAAGDLASARLILTLVAEAGDAQAAFVLAGTFDPTVLANLRAIGVRPDLAKARAWYARAAELGSLEARQRVQALR